ncbi:hypothetical protein [Heyndrickxia coagulans]|uniref:hypothetical protein n=1 Tax=Heyndrickxia coagulans TaxID=1398 RepID=UPI00128FB3A5|nr:hypothetical protein [Heyndrickxia coagulans]
MLAGHPDNARHVNVASGDKPGEVLIEVGPGMKRAYVPDGIEWEESAKRSGGKAAGGAIVGTVVAGPLGGIAGAAVGGRRRDNSKAYVYLIDPETGEEITLHIRCDQAQYRQINNLFNDTLRGRA